MISLGHDTFIYHYRCGFLSCGRCLHLLLPIQHVKNHVNTFWFNLIYLEGLMSLVDAFKLNEYVTFLNVTTCCSSQGVQKRLRTQS